MSGTVVHLLNRGVKREELFSSPADYAAFLALLRLEVTRVPLRLLAFCLMPNHWHLVAWPSADGQVSRFLHWLTATHALQRHRLLGTRGTGAVYQSRFKSFPVESDESYLRVVRYVERNALRAGLVARAEEWAWGSLALRVQGRADGLLVDGPLALPGDWVSHVNAIETEAELAALRRASRRGSPVGSPEWVEATAKAWGLEATLRPLGRPRREAR